MLFRHSPTALAIVYGLLLVTAGRAAEPLTLATALAEADRSASNPAHLKYEEHKFWPAMGTPLANAMVACTRDATVPATFDLVFVISSQGHIKHILHAPNDSVAACVAARLQTQVVPSPPHDSWLVALHMTTKK